MDGGDEETGGAEDGRSLDTALDGVLRVVSVVVAGHGGWWYGLARRRVVKLWRFVGTEGGWLCGIKCQLGAGDWMAGWRWEADSHVTHLVLVGVGPLMLRAMSIEQAATTFRASSNSSILYLKFLAQDAM